MKTKALTFNEKVALAMEKLHTDHTFDVFDSFIATNDGFTVVKLTNKYNFVTSEWNLLSKQWFDGWTPFNHGIASVLLNDKYVRINAKGEICEDESAPLQFSQTTLENVAFFDYEKVHKVMSYLSWQWEFPDDSHIPTVDELKDFVVSEIIRMEEKNINSTMSGGFEISKDGDDYEIKFVVESSF